MPLIVTTLPLQLLVTPAGRPATVAPVAVVVPKVMGVIKVLIQTTWLFVPAPELNAMVLLGNTVIVPVMVFVPPVQPPVIVIV